MKPSSQKWLLEVKDLVPMPFSVVVAGLMIATAALPVVGDRSTSPAFADRSENALHIGDIIGEAMPLITTHQHSYPV
jgi:hypothetical protein